MFIFPNKKIYIGVTKNSTQERREQGYHHNKLLQKAIRKYGWKNICVKILADGLSQEQSFEIERAFILGYRANEPNVGYNISSGGKATFLGLKHTDEYKKKMSELYKWKKHTEDEILRFREAHAKERNPVCQYTLDGELIKEHESFRAAAISVCGHTTNISRAVKSGKPYKQSVWKRKEVV